LKQKELFISIKSKKDIENIFNKSIAIKSKYLMAKVIITKKENLLPLEILWAIPKKIKKAVERNHLKRILRAGFFEVFKNARQVFNLKNTSAKMAVLPKPEFAVISYEKRQEDITLLLNNILKILNN